MNKRVLSVLLSLVLLVSLIGGLTVTASADSDTITYTLKAGDTVGKVCACLYNVDMMEETSHVLAMGANGISKRIWPEEGHITRAPNVSNIEEYIRRTDEMLARKREIFPEA